MVVQPLYDFAMLPNSKFSLIFDWLGVDPGTVELSVGPVSFVMAAIIPSEYSVTVLYVLLELSLVRVPLCL